MCGFVGFYNLQRQEFSCSEKLLHEMNEKIKHRGPDAAGLLSLPEHGLGLAARRLSIIDLSAAGNQPIQSADGRFVIVFNGEIYNYASLRNELEQLGYVFKSTSDTEVLLTAFAAWGHACLDRLDGMFAFVLFDKLEEALYLVRDRFGVKPLYFSVQGNVLSFASEIKALWELPWMVKKISPLGWYHYLTFMVSPAPMTIFDGVYKLPAGFYAHVDKHKRLSFTEWYSPIKSLTDAEKREMQSEDFCIERITELLRASVKKRMVADVPVGAFLSGGLDSSLIVAMMAELGITTKTFTVAFKNAPEHNEFAWARRVAELFGTQHHELEISEQEAFDFYKPMINQLDEPLADVVCIPFYHVALLAHQHGMKVVQVGEGADELFFGYSSYAHYAQWHKRFWQPSHALLPESIRRGIYNAARSLMHNQPIKLDFLNNWSSNRGLFWGGAIAFSETQKQASLGNMRSQRLEKDYIVDQVHPGLQQSFDSFDIVSFHLKNLLQQDSQADLMKQMMYLELKQRLPELLLMRADKMSMATSVEAREPFLDYQLVEFMLNVPGHLKFKNNTTKYLLKKVAEQFLPHDIIYRKKVGFGAPLASWLTEGKHFPAYFSQLSYDAHYALGADFATPLWQVNAEMNKNAGHRAVQNWVLQQLWAFNQ